MGLAHSWFHPMLALSQQTWQQVSLFGIRQRWETLTVVSTTILLTKGSSRVGFGCLWLSCPQALASWVADLP